MEFVEIKIPKPVYELLSRRGIDVEAEVLDKLLSELDPPEEAAERVRLAERFYAEAMQYVERGDPVQASEKLYKAAEECVKALATWFKTPEAAEARREGRWWTKLLARAAKTLSAMLNQPQINIGWSVAYDLHVWGFHEAALAVEHVKAAAPQIEKLLETTKALLRSSHT